MTNSRHTPALRNLAGILGTTATNAVTAPMTPRPLLLDRRGRAMSRDADAGALRRALVLFVDAAERFVVRHTGSGTGNHARREGARAFRESVAQVQLDFDEMVGPR